MKQIILIALTISISSPRPQSIKHDVYERYADQVDMIYILGHEDLAARAAASVGKVAEICERDVEQPCVNGINSLDKYFSNIIFNISRQQGVRSI